MPMRDASTFTRGTNRAGVDKFHPYPENEFWRQAQKVLGRYLTSKDYGKAIYVPAKAASGNTVAQEILDFLDIEEEMGCLLLVGQYGVGKSAALKHFDHEFVKPHEDDDEPWLWIYFNANDYRIGTADPDKQLYKVVADVVFGSFLHDYLKRTAQSFDDFFDDLLENDPSFRRMRQLSGSHSRIDGIRDELSQYLKSNDDDCLKATLKYLGRRTRPSRVVLALDNFDSQAHSIQRAAVRLGDYLSRSCSVKVVIPVRRSTAADLRYGDSDMFSPFHHTTVMAPDMTEVIRRRLEQAMASPEAQEVSLGEGALRARVSECDEFVTVLVHGLSAPGVPALLNNMSNESVREALQLARNIYSSHFIDARRIIRKISPASQISPVMWHGTLPYYVIVKALLLRNQPVYLPDVSRIGNVFGTSVPNHRFNPFLRCYLLSVLEPGESAEKSGEKPVAEYKSVLHDLLQLEDGAISSEMDWLRRQGWIVHPDREHVKLTQRGAYIRHTLMFDVEYLTHISTDVRMYPELCQNLKLPAESLSHRMNNLVLLLEFLVKREWEVLREFSRELPRNFLEALGHTFFSKRILQECRRSIVSINIETDDPREAAIEEARKKIQALEESEEMQKCAQFFVRYGQ